MANLAQVAGYLLEEVLAYLLQAAGYRLLTRRTDDPAELCENNAGELLVKGRGGNHQVDVLGEFTMVPAFSEPLRLIVEAKAQGQAAGIHLVRNAVGVVRDVNEAWMLDYSPQRSRRHYRYALFSTAGFSKPAQGYALAHQISLVDLSGPEWGGLAATTQHEAARLLDALNTAGLPFRKQPFRAAVRRSLGTVDRHREDYGEELPEPVMRAARHIANEVNMTVGAALLAFSGNQQMLLARPEDLGRFLRYAEERPQHHVALTLRRPSEAGRGNTWDVQPTEDRDAYRLSVTLPVLVEQRALAESERLAQSLAAKNALGGRLQVFWDPHGFDAVVRGPRMFRLNFAGADLRRRATAP